MRNVVHVDLGRGVVERTTAGWTDEKVRLRPVEYFDKEIGSAERVLTDLKKYVEQQEKFLDDWRALRRRREELGG